MKHSAREYVDALPSVASEMHPQVRIDLAIAAIKACSVEDRAEIVAAVCPTIPDDVWDDRAAARATAQIAKDFFDTSSEATVKIYAAAAWERMSPASRSGFIAWVQKQVAQSLPKSAQEPSL